MNYKYIENSLYYVYEISKLYYNPYYYLVNKVITKENINHAVKKVIPSLMTLETIKSLPYVYQKTKPKIKPIEMDLF